jgi:hypothetical protein
MAQKDPKHTYLRKKYKTFEEPENTQRNENG